MNPGYGLSFSGISGSSYGYDNVRYADSIGTGNDSQVLYENRHGETTRGWRLTHPLCEELQPATMSD